MNCQQCKDGVPYDEHWCKDEPCPVIKGFTRDPNYDPDNDTQSVTITTRPTADGKIVTINFNQ